jgi:hypothetical protein
MSRLRIAVPRLAAIDCGVLPPRAGGAASAAREQRPLAGVDGGSGAAKMPFEILILMYCFDSSALVKRYASEQGSAWVKSLGHPVQRTRCIWPR